MPSGTYTHSPPDAPPGPVTPIPRDNVLIGQPGAYGISADKMLFLSAVPDQVVFAPGSNRNGVGLLDGGYVTLNGNGNVVVAQAGSLYAGDNPGDTGNAIAIGSGVSFASLVLQPSDGVFLVGVTQADIDAAFTSLQQHPQAGYAEYLSLPRAGGAPLTLMLPMHHIVPPTVGQFHAV
jgi:hypothetical protein